LKNSVKVLFQIHYISLELIHQGAVHEIEFHKVSIQVWDEEDPVGFLRHTHTGVRFVRFVRFVLPDLLVSIYV